MVIHFYHREFMTCKVMDKHLKELAPKVLAAKFLKVDGEWGRRRRKRMNGSRMRA